MPEFDHTLNQAFPKCPAKNELYHLLPRQLRLAHWVNDAISGAAINVGAAIQRGRVFDKNDCSATRLLDLTRRYADRLLRSGSSKSHS